jgi:enoyl-CoA hydratase/carnithine racemase
MSDIRVDHGSVRTITLTRPGKRNALTREMFATLWDVLESDPPPEQRVTVLRSTGPVFCAGVDLSERASNPSAAGESPLERLCAALHAHPLPVVAVVQGAAIGGGLMLALHCDFVIADEAAMLGNAAVQMGLVPAWDVARRVLALAGAATARELLLLGDPLPAARLGHVLTAAVPAEALDATAARLIARLEANAPLSLRAIKATLNARAYAEAPHENADALIARAQRSEDSREGVLARREKRPATFAGR